MSAPAHARESGAVEMAPGRRRGSASRGEIVAYGALVAVALVLRLIDLGERPYHHDESQDAYFSWILLTNGDYEYDPLLHGPLRFYLTAAILAVLGDTDFTARLAPVLMGTAMVALAWGLRPLTGRIAAFVVAVLLAVGPSYLYFSRFAREDIYIACLTLALLVVVFRLLDRPRPWQPAAVGALLAASFATKESTYITCFVFGTFLLAWLVTDLVRGRRDLVARLALGRRAWLSMLGAFAVVYLLLFTTFGTALDHWDGLWEGLDYWLGQHDVGRGGEAWFFYIVILALEEWPVLVLGAIGAWAAWRRPTPLAAFCVWGFVVSLAVYSWAGEKFAWLVLHPLLPLIVLSGLGVQYLWRSPRAGVRRAGAAVTVVAGFYVVLASWWVNAEHRTDPRELLVSTQSAEDVLGIRDRVLALAERRVSAGGPPLTVTVDTSQGATFPWAWYFRDLESVSYVDLSLPGTASPGSDVLVATDASRQRLAPELAGYEARQFGFRVWWVRDYGPLGPVSALEWIATREPWNETGGMPAWLLVRRGA
ncbi:MAG: hypothetical protein AVDCRST_MAG69-2642 [uncultured Solirubrobacteraceae bacterium]|uniref:Glycosyltransferase RgtA/B/C/D-like domain-containing protein n=1 Tax=uncultured Solirubrobacteraceae bacterium TaxID=1162706 RepID=A0A6J4T5P0_9ACTN|nr:MAG: hypothetical protein AVDCRST_MAG69-2642 [uncultured Solirubrobacteraceae bacterium]